MKKRINEGGNIFKNADGQPDTIRINRVDVEPTVDRVSYERCVPRQ